MTGQPSPSSATAPSAPADTTAAAVAATVLVLCGGTSERMRDGAPDPVDKTRAAFGDSTVLDHLLDGLPGTWPVVCVGRERLTRRPVTWCVEDPPLGGPGAGIATGVALVRTPITVVVAGDQPFAAAAVDHLVTSLQRQPDDVAGVAGRDASGWTQPLLAAYRTAPLAEAFPPGTRDVGIHRTVRGLRLHLLDLVGPASLDVDEPADLARARALLGRDELG